MSWRLGLASLAAIAALARPAPAAEETEAERLFRQGRAAMLDGRFDEACPLFEESQRLERRVGTLLNLAACHERQDRLAAAWTEYTQAREDANEEDQPDRARFASERAELLAPRLAWLRIDGAEARVDGRLFGATEVPLDPGAHLIEAPGFRESVELKAGEHRVVAIVPPPPPVVIAPPPPPPARVDPAPPGVTSSGHFVFEPGMFFAFVQAQGQGGDVRGTAESTGLREVATGRRVSCAEVGGCRFGDLEVPPTAAFGFQFFGGYQWWDRVALGLRVLVGPLLSGGLLFMTGPEISFRPLARLDLGAFVALGSWTMNGKIPVDPPFGYMPFGPGDEIEQRRGSGGAGLSIGLSIVTLERGAIALTATPFFMGLSREAVFVVPVGVGYRFH